MQISGKAVNSLRRTQSYSLWPKPSILCRDYNKFRYVSTASISRSPSVIHRHTQSNFALPKCNQDKHMTLSAIQYPNDSCIFPLPNGNILSYARVGLTKEVGQVWVFFHGTPGCRVLPSRIVNYAENHRFRIIAIDRPGYGYSTVHDRGMLGFMQDVECLLNYLGIQEFKVYGVSGGGPYALAAAYYFAKSRLLKTLVVCGVPHPDFGHTSKILLWNISLWFRTWASFLVPGVNFNGLLWKDIVSLKDDPKKVQIAAMRSREMRRQGSKGYNNDWRVSRRPWGFDLQNMDANPIMWYHGSLDLNTAADAARATANMANRHRRIVQFQEIPGLDHYTLQGKMWAESVAWLKKPLSIRK
ncbi:Alpha Beta hydrolase [Pyrenophora seminiperda CCB06]|uniref:Alpha Beta hydrolase n=1 Tax=Pyrenophora seminiperda CCB06 TaxID=1302712 RepID=A0A3M7M2M2_9PLEO|nr:Alpha Beta hydrolase [Pyrenophora seminiperda CCB06]